MNLKNRNMKDSKLEIPHGFALCGEADCLCAAKCLRHKAYLQQAETAKVLLVVNPRLCTKDGRCAYFRDVEPVRFASGFTQMQKRMLPDQYDKFMWKLILHFGRNPYFERRNGKREISPGEQELIADVARQVGVTEEFKFDAYQERQDWTN